MSGGGGPLAGCRIVEVASIGPGPFAGMMLADMGADVIRIERVGGGGDPLPTSARVMNRGRPSVSVDLKAPEGVGLVLRLVEGADALIEGFRPGAMERLGLGPEPCLARNPRLVYGRITGWGQSGPYAAMAGHDINYIALAGVLAHVGRDGGPPVPPMNLVGDFGGGGMLLAFGVVCGLLEARASGRGQVVDAAMVDGSALLMAMMHGLAAAGSWTDRRGGNLLDSGAPFYDAFETADGRWISIGPLEPKFFAELLERTGLADEGLPAQYDRSGWPRLRDRLRAVFASRTRDGWCALLEGTDVCFAPVLTMSEAASHPHLVSRRTFVEVDGVTQPAPAPRFSRTPGAVRHPPSEPGAAGDEALIGWGLAPDEITGLREAGALA